MVEFTAAPIPPNLNATKEDIVRTIANIYAYRGRVDELRKGSDDVDKSVINSSRNSLFNDVSGY